MKKAKKGPGSLGVSLHYFIPFRQIVHNIISLNQLARVHFPRTDVQQYPLLVNTVSSGS